jgi:uroporphyrinogen-III synthase
MRSRGNTSPTVRRRPPKILAGIRVLVGRAQHQASKLSEALRSLGAGVIEIPFIEIRPPQSYKPIDTALKHAAEYDWLILTSVNGVEAVAARLKHLKIPLAQLTNMQIAAIGPATRNAVERLGLSVSVVPPKYIAESVVESLRRNVSGKRILLARAKVARDVIPRELRSLSATIDVVEVYETVLPPASKERLQALMKNQKLRPHVVTFTSSSTVRNFVSLLGSPERLPQKVLDGIQLASIGPITSATLREFGLPVHIEASEYTIPGLVHAIAASIRSQT